MPESPAIVAKDPKQIEAVYSPTDFAAYVAARKAGIGDLAEPVAGDPEKESPRDTSGDGAPGGEQATKPGDGDGQPDKSGEDPEKESTDGEPKTKLEEFAIERRLSREKRRSERILSEKDKRIEQLEQEMAKLQGGEAEVEGEGLTKAPDPDDEKYSEDYELYLDDLERWEAQGQKPATKKVVQEKAQTPKKTARDRMLDSLYATLDGADKESQLTGKFKEAVENGSIELSDELLRAFDDPKFPDEELQGIAQMFLDRPALSGRIARRRLGTHFEELMSVIAYSRTRGEDGAEERPSDFKQLKGTGKESRIKHTYDIAEEGDYLSYVKRRTAEKEAQVKAAS